MHRQLSVLPAPLHGPVAERSGFRRHHSGYEEVKNRSHLCLFLFDPVQVAAGTTHIFILLTYTVKLKVLSSIFLV